MRGGIRSRRFIPGGTLKFSLCPGIFRRSCESGSNRKGAREGSNHSKKTYQRRMDEETILLEEELLVDRGQRKLVLSMHAQEIALHRMIAFNEIASAVDHGRKESADNGAWLFWFAGVAVVGDQHFEVVLTVYPEPGFGINAEKRKITPKMLDQNFCEKRRLQEKSC